MRKDTLMQRVEKIKDLSNYTIEIGIQGTYIEPGESDGYSLVAIAIKNEFGYGIPGERGYIPSRPWMRTTVKEHATKNWRDGMRKIGVLAVRGQTKKIEQGFRILGAEMVADMQDMLREGDWEPNSPVTIELKGSDQPLVDTGQLVQSHRAVLNYKGRRTLIA